MNNPSLPLFVFVRYNYGQENLRVVRRFLHESCRVIRFREHLYFLHRCKSENLVPKGLRVKPLVSSAEGRRVAQRAGLQFVSAQISLCHRTIGGSNSALVYLRSELEQVLPTSIVLAVLDEGRKQIERTRFELRAVHDRKLSRLRGERSGCISRTKHDAGDPNSILNLSSRRLDSAEMSLLMKGLNFSPSPTFIPAAQIIASIESAITGVPEEEKVVIRTDISHVLRHSVAPESNISIMERNALKALRADKSIVVLPADKGRTTVVMDRTDYQIKALQLLSDTRTYTVLEKDPTAVTERDMNRKLLKLAKNSRLDDQLYSRLRSSSGRIPLFYGLPKVHKDGIPLRPIVSFCSSPTYRLSKFLAGLLSPLVGQSRFTVSTTKDFCQALQDIVVGPDEIMVSFDVVSLFTCIPTNFAVECALERLHQDVSLAERTSLSPDDVCELLQFCLDSTCFAFGGTVYKQCNGTAMGSPVSSVVANLCMEPLEETALEGGDFGVRMWKRYVDDTFVIMRRSAVDEFHQHLNAQNPHIQFTLETEENASLPFLDVEVHREPDGHLTTKVYRKPTHTDQYLHFRSHHPTCHKASVVRTLSLRAETHCSNPIIREREQQHLNAALQRNGYPKGFIVRNRGGSRRQRGSDEPRTARRTVALPYIRNTSEQLARILRRAGIQTFYKPCTTLREMLVRVKDAVPPLDCSGVIYSIPCSNCDKVYIGQTLRSAKVRRKGHLDSLRRGDYKSKLAEHAVERDHEPSWEDTNILHRNINSKVSRLVLEAWETSLARKHAINTAMPLPEAYHTLTQKFGKSRHRS